MGVKLLWFFFKSIFTSFDEIEFENLICFWNNNIFLGGWVIWHFLSQFISCFDGIEFEKICGFFNFNFFCTNLLFRVKLGYTPNLNNQYSLVLKNIDWIVDCINSEWSNSNNRDSLENWKFGTLELGMSSVKREWRYVFYLNKQKMCA